MGRWSCVLVLLGAGGCELFGNPGELVGEMSVQATLEENSCGSAIGTIPASQSSEVKLYERSGLLTWSGSLGSFQAEIDEDGSFVSHSSGSQLLRAAEPDGAGGIRAACVVDAVEEIRGTLTRREPETEGDAGDGGATDDAGDADAGEVPRSPASVTAIDTLQIAPSAGADCSDLVGLGGGLFQALPCRVVIELSGSEE
jgi:hypothetical protein